ncbi:MAG: AtpZ/AtpI family protein [Gemmatimonadetes bacterium]|nr:AtpZ/AtpI family protein [Gemmatimonadota bacterium]
MAGLGLQFVVTILVCLFVGQWLDRKFGTTPWLLVVGVLFGAGLGMWMMIRTARSVSEESGEREEKRVKGGVRGKE